MRASRAIPRRRWLQGMVCASLLAGALALPAGATELHLQVSAAGKPVDAAVASLHSAAAAAAVKPGQAVIDQRNTQFVPRVSVITTGTRVIFPNSDNVRHQVYSFSPAKRFELPLYSGRAAPPVTFDTPGVVVLGCNIHDWMLAYVVVLDTPYSATTGSDGQARLDAPAGTYTLRVWHPDIRSKQPLEREITLGSTPVSTTVTLDLAPQQAAPAAPADDRLRALQEKLRKLKEGG
ncbi:MAG: methylamine utilization protein [Thermomonas haemolytica]